LFSTDAWQRNLKTYETIREMPFNRELADGSLSSDRFRHYIVQDAHYLEGFGRALSLASAKGHTAEHVAHFAAAAQTAILVERSLHAEYFGVFQITPEAAAATEPTPVCEHYVSYLLRVAALEPFEVTLAAVLPCFWIYREVGKHIHAQAVAGNPYQAWIDTYAGEEFDQAVDAVIEITDHLAQHASSPMEAAMHHAFRRAVQLEWLFWDSAHRLAAWPV
jgi:thiaminase/transcriptional activator TenA